MNSKKILLTGASSGIGKALLHELFQEGHHIVASSRTIEGKIQEKDHLWTKNADVSRPEQIDDLFQFAQEKLGHIDIYIGNAGYSYYEKIENPDWQKIQSIFETNVYSVIYGAEKMKALNNDRPFQVICTASAMSYFSLPGYALYCSTKAALRGFADSYRYELGPGQYFQMVYPIATRTDFFKHEKEAPMPWPSQSPEKVAKKIVKGIKNKKNHIYPSFLFWIMKHIIPVSFKVYAKIEYRKLKKISQ